MDCKSARPFSLCGFHPIWGFFGGGGVPKGVGAQPAHAVFQPASAAQKWKFLKTDFFFHSKHPRRSNILCKACFRPYSCVLHCVLFHAVHCAVPYACWCRARRAVHCCALCVVSYAPCALHCAVCASGRRCALCAGPCAMRRAAMRCAAYAMPCAAYCALCAVLCNACAPTPACPTRPTCPVVGEGGGLRWGRG